MFEIDVLRNSSHNFLGVLRGAFQGLGVQKEALLAKTMGSALELAPKYWPSY